MAKKNPINVSNETIDEALAIAKKTQKPGQTKEQTRIIAQGIQKGIAEYKKSAKAKQRQADKAQKKQQKLKQPQNSQQQAVTIEPSNTKKSPLPWGLLVVSWVSFALYFFYTK